MPYKPHSIQDDIAATQAIDQFIAGYEPLLYAADLNATPEQVWDTLRVALKHCRDNHSRPTAGRPKIKTDNPRSLASRRYRAKKAAHSKGGT